MNNDLISRKSLLEWAREFYPNDLQFASAVINAPVADTERRGEWIPDDYAYYHCSECGYEQDEREYVSPYCPKCGAKMGGGEE